MTPDEAHAHYKDQIAALNGDMGWQWERQLVGVIEDRVMTDDELRFHEQLMRVPAGTYLKGWWYNAMPVFETEASA